MKVKKIKKSQEAKLTAYTFPAFVRASVKSAYPELSNAQLMGALEGLKDFFRLSIMANGEFVAMPSSAVNAAWQAFVLCTKEYSVFCKSVLNQFVHHDPACSLNDRYLEHRLDYAYLLCCIHEGLDPLRKQTPRLFSIDDKLGLSEEQVRMVDRDNFKLQAEDSFITGRSRSKVGSLGGTEVDIPKPRSEGTAD